jgi:hypothetical protein
MMVLIVFGPPPRFGGSTPRQGENRKTPLVGGIVPAKTVPNILTGETFTNPTNGGGIEMVRFDFAKVSIGRNSNAGKGLGKIFESDLTVSHKMERRKENRKNTPCDCRR